MPTLTEKVQRFIVEELATFQSPSEVAASVKEEFGLEVTRQQVEYYNPRRRAGQKGLAKKWVALFEAARKRWSEEVGEVAVAHRRYRIERLQDYLRTAEKMGRTGNIPLAIQLLEQARKEIEDEAAGERDDRTIEVGIRWRLPADRQAMAAGDA